MSPLAPGNDTGSCRHRTRRKCASRLFSSLQTTTGDVDASRSRQFAGNLWLRFDIPYCMRLTILASEVCSEYLCDFAADGFVLDPEGNGVSAGVYCERCGRQMVSEYNQKVSPGWKFQPGQILGDPTERRPSAPRYPGAKRTRPNQEPEKPCSFLSYVVDRLTSQPRDS